LPDHFNGLLTLVELIVFNRYADLILVASEQVVLWKHWIVLGSRVTCGEHDAVDVHPSLNVVLSIIDDCESMGRVVQPRRSKQRGIEYRVCRICRFPDDLIVKVSRVFPLPRRQSG
jgi:hypothetical protein